MGASAAGTPTQPDAPSPAPAGGMRASDAERDEVVARLREEFAAGRLSHDTFMYRMNAVLQARHQADLPPLLADLPAERRRPGFAGSLSALVTRLRAAQLPAPQLRAIRLPVARPRLRQRPLRARRARPVDPWMAEPRRPLALLEFPRGVGDSFSIGRSSGCDLAIADLTVSRTHARLDRTPDGWLLTDLGSTNGTRVNGWRVRGEVRVRPGDLVSFGDAEYSLCVAEDA